MKSLKLFIIVGVSFLLGSIVATALVWYYFVIAPMQDAKNAAADLKTNVQEVAETVADTVTGSDGTETTPSAGGITEPVVIDTSTLSDSQKSVLGTLGVDGDQIVITPEAYQCAAAALGEDRLNEIVNGAAPGVIESAQLLRCYNQ